MGILESLKGVLSGSGKSAEPITFEPGETEIARTVGCTLKGGKPWVGGDLVLTDKRLLFTPLNTADVAVLLQYGLKKAGAPGSAVTAVGWVQGQIQQIPTDLAAISNVTIGRQADAFHPPAFAVHLADGQTLEFGVLKSRLSPNGSGGNNTARDQFVSQLQSRLQS